MGWPEAFTAEKIQDQVGVMPLSVSAIAAYSAVNHAVGPLWTGRPGSLLSTVIAIRFQGGQPGACRGPDACRARRRDELLLPWSFLLPLPWSFLLPHTLQCSHSRLCRFLSHSPHEGRVGREAGVDEDGD